MRGDALFVLLVVAASLVLFVSERIALELVALLVVLALMLGGILPPAEALAGFSDPLVVTIGALFVVGAAVQHTGLGAALGDRLARLAGEGEARLIVATMVAGAGLSAFMSTTGTVAVLLPVVVGIARRNQTSPARLLIPLAYGALLGGPLTLVSTPPNLIVSEGLVAQGQPPLGFFELTPLGLALLAVGIAYMVLVGRHLLPSGAQSAAAAAAPRADPARAEEHTPSRYVSRRLARLRLPRGGPLAGRRVAELAPRSRTGVTVVAVERRGGRLAAAGPDTRLRPGDVLVVHGEPDAVARLVGELELESTPPSAEEVDPAAEGEELGTAEALLTPRSAYLGRSLAELRLRDRTGVTALAVLRGGAPIKDELATTPLAMGDTLVLHGPWARLALLRDDEAQDLVVLGPLAPRHQPARRMVTTAAVVVLMVTLMASGVVPVVAAALLAALAAVLSRCVTLEQAYRGVSWSALILIAGLLPLATALQRTGAVPILAEGLVGALGPLGPTLALAGIFALTSVLGQFISNTATAVLLAPLVHDVALALGAAPRTYLIALAAAASMAFSTPIASPVNTLILTPGGYRFRDFLRVGLPLQVLMLVATVALLQLFAA